MAENSGLQSAAGPSPAAPAGGEPLPLPHGAADGNPGPLQDGQLGFPDGAATRGSVVTETIIPQEWIGDARAEWLREKVCVGLDITHDVFDTVFNEEAGAQSLTLFLDKFCTSVFFYVDPRSEPIVTKVPIFVEFSAEEIVERKQARKEARAAARAKFEQDVAAKAAEDEANGIAPALEPPVFVPDPEPPAGSEQERGVWETKDVHSIRYFQVLCAIAGPLHDDALNRSIMYVINISPGPDPLNYDKMHSQLEFGILPCGPSLSELERVHTLTSTPK